MSERSLPPVALGRWLRIEHGSFHGEHHHSAELICGPDSIAGQSSAMIFSCSYSFVSILVSRCHARPVVLPQWFRIQLGSLPGVRLHSAEFRSKARFYCEPYFGKAIPLIPCVSYSHLFCQRAPFSTGVVVNL